MYAALWSRASKLAKVQLTLGLVLSAGSVALGGVAVPEAGERVRTVELHVQQPTRERSDMIQVDSKRASVVRAVKLVNDALWLGELVPLQVTWDADLNGLGQLLWYGKGQGGTVVLNPRSTPSQQVYAMLHELGHYLDFEKALDSLPVVRIMRRTPSVVELFKARQDGDEWSGYAIETAELFARGFAQWIAERSGDSQALRGVRDFGTGQWTVEEFEPVREAFENITN